MARIQLPPVIRRWRLFAAVTAISALAGSGVLLAASSDPKTAVAFHTVATTRVFDSRQGTGVPLGAKATFDVEIPNLPDDVTAVGVNVTIVDGTAASFLAVYPTGDTRPPTSTINWSSAGAVANSATVVVHSDHSLRLYNMNGTVHVVIDLLGYYSPSPVGGATGATGATGAAGAAGAVGGIGATGATGAVGGIGDVGAVGATGGIGATGAAGAAGAAGGIGATGAVGGIGATGAVGAAGAVGATGAQGGPGVNGTNGVAVRIYGLDTTLGIVPTGAPVVFNSLGPIMADFSVTGGGDVFSATAAGVYRVTFGLLAVDSSQFRIVTSSSPAASWTFNGSPGVLLSGTALVTLGANDYLSVVNKTGTPVVLAAPSAWIVIEKM